MAYIGSQPTVGLVTKLSDIASSFDGILTTFQLSIPPGGTGNNFTPGSVYQIIVSLGGVIQNPAADYTLNGSQITFTTAPASGLTCFIIALGQSINVGTPGAGTVTTSTLASPLDPIVSSLNGGPIAGTRNRVINGDMRIDQRNAGAAVTNPGTNYTLDRWSINTNLSSVCTIQQNAGSVTPPAGFTNYLGATSTAATSLSTANYFQLRQPVEGFNSSDLAWGTANAKTVTVSFWAYSSLTGTFSGSIRNNPSFTYAYPFSYSIPSANTWTYVTVTIPGPNASQGTWNTNNGAGLEVVFSLGSGTNLLSSANSWQAGIFAGVTSSVQILATNGATFYITGVQLEPGTVATPFERRSYGQELALCQRYYEKSYNIDVVPGTVSVAGRVKGENPGGGTWDASNIIQFSVVKRAVPTMTTYRDNPATTPWMTADNIGTRGGNVFITLAAGQVWFGHWTASAEL